MKNFESATEQQAWLDKCAARFVERGGLTQEEAGEAALIMFQEADEGADPVEAADEDMSYWTDDEPA